MLNTPNIDLQIEMLVDNIITLQPRVLLLAITVFHYYDHDAIYSFDNDNRHHYLATYIVHFIKDTESSTICVNFVIEIFIFVKCK